MSSVPGWGLSFFSTWFLFSLSAVASPLDSLPTRTPEPVYDAARIFSANEKSDLDREIRALFETGKVQIQIITLESLKGQPIESLSIEIAERWKIGNQNGILILIAPNDRKVRIEVGYDLEGVIPDVVAGRWIRDLMAPQFKKQKYHAGVRAVLLRIREVVIDGESAAETASGSGSRRSSFWITFVIFLLFVVVGPLLQSAPVTRGRRTHWGGGGFGGLGGGGGGRGWGGGSGGFGGGGASGNW